MFSQKPYSTTRVASRLDVTVEMQDTVYNEARSPAGYYFYSLRHVSVGHCDVILLKARRQWE